MRQRMVERHQMRVHPLEQAVRALLRHADQAHAVTERRRLRDIGGQHMAHAADRDVVKGGLGAEGDGRQDRQLVRASTPSMSKLGSASA